MYEFSNKEIIKKFKETEYGKKTNRWLYTSIVFVLVLFIATILLEIFLKENIISSIVKCLFLISVITTCYFDGKRDGAIEQFKKSNK